MTDPEFFRLLDQLAVLREQVRIEREKKMVEDGWIVDMFPEYAGSKRLVKCGVDPKSGEKYRMGDAANLWLNRKSRKAAMCLKDCKSE